MTMIRCIYIAVIKMEVGCLGMQQNRVGLKQVFESEVFESTSAEIRPV